MQAHQEFYRYRQANKTGAVEQMGVLSLLRISTGGPVLDRGIGSGGSASSPSPSGGASSPTPAQNPASPNAPSMVRVPPATCLRMTVPCMSTTPTNTLASVW